LTTLERQLLYPLNRFYAEAGRSLPLIHQISDAEIPEPYRRLLVHEDDMTPTLEAFHGEHAGLRVIARHLDGDILSRMVVLTLNGSARPVEFGAILIYLNHFPPEAREAILACRRPLGTILTTHYIQHTSCPQAFFKVQSDALMNEALGLKESGALYGRRNMLFTPENRILADIVEILPTLEGSVEP